MLTYENQMFLDILHEDGLLILGKGLGLEHTFASLIKVYSDPGNLVLVLGTTEAEEEFFISKLEEQEEETGQSCKPPRKITTDYSTTERQKIYLEGGVLFITTRILTVDMLMERIPMDLITGILVYRAHATASSCQESFILRLFRQKNKSGFIKAFSSAPGAIKDVNRIMRNLFVKNLYLWPRFHSDITTCLKETTEPDVVEIHLSMTQPMMAIQTACLDLLHFTLQELKRLNPSLESYDELSVENAVAKTFHKLLQRELDPVWHQLSWKTKQLVADLKTLRTLLMYLTQYDCITFYAFVSALRTTENAMKTGGWMILDSAETLFITSRQRVFGGEEEESLKRLQKIESGEELDLKFEENPKWEALSEILKEIKKELEENGLVSAVPTEKVLVLTSDERTSYQVQDFLTVGAKGLMVRMFNKSLGEKFGRIPDVSGPEEPPPPKQPKEMKHKGRGKKSAPNQTLTQMVREEEPVKTEGFSNGEDSGKKLTVPKSPVTMIQSMQVGSFELYKILYEKKPRYVIMYDTEMSVVRQLEVYQANNPDVQIRVYFLMYEKSVEEQAYLTTLRKEKESFEHLIREKSTMVIPEDRDGKAGLNEDLIRDSKKASDAIMENSNSMTRKGRSGGANEEVKASSKVIVDMREFRSELPPLIHKRGIDIEPVTLEVGDYILTPEICVERKSISDLIGSLQGGRLFNQATSMTRFYAKPMLLIEFDQNKPFALQGKYYLSRDIASTDITARLQLLTIHFPKLRILWSPSPHATAELFEELKKGRAEPDAAKAAAMSFDFIDDYNVDKYNPSVRDFVSKLPGITSKNIFAILNSIDNLADLMNLTREDLSDILGSKQNADALYEGVHEKTEAPVALGDRGQAEKKRSAAQVGKGPGGRFKSKAKRQKKASL